MLRIRRVEHLGGVPALSPYGGEHFGGGVAQVGHAARRVLEAFSSYKAPHLGTFDQRLEDLMGGDLTNNPFRDVYDADGCRRERAVQDRSGPQQRTPPRRWTDDRHEAWPAAPSDAAPTALDACRF